MTVGQRLFGFVALAFALGAPGCGVGQRGEAAAGPERPRPEPFAFSGPVASALQSVDQERRLVRATGAGTWTWRGRLPAHASLLVGGQLEEAARAAGSRLAVTIRLHDGGERKELMTARGDGEHWLDLDVDLSRFAGRQVELEIEGRSEGAPATIGWGPLALSPAAQSERPNIVLVVVDTLRADHLTPYGYGRPTSPAIERGLARAGAVCEAAYSQAPWTLPSVASFLTSRYPGELVGGDLGSFGIPAAVPTLAERLRAAGYRTAGFVANPTLHPGNGFDRGFETFYTPPASIDSMLLHGDGLNRRTAPWLRAGDSRPFFLYVHYIDPHDPYENPETPGGRSVYFPDYGGPITGSFVHGIYVGRIALPDPENDIRQVTALYDSEVHYVDGRIGELLEQIPPEVMRNTLVMLTADHGEELHDHGGWKHGQTLYDEQIHVPLLVRWDGRIAPGTRLRDAVRLLDLAPTLLAAAGAPGDPGDQGIDLMPALTGRAALPRLPVIAEHLATGPRRAAAIVDGRKLILFDRRQPFVPADALQDHLWRVDMARLQRIESYDLVADPAERHDLDDRGGDVERLQPLIHRQLDRELPGLRVMFSGMPPGLRLDGTIRFERPPTRWMPYFLGEEDAIELDGAVLRFSVGGEALTKGVLVEGELGALLDLSARLDASQPGSVALLTGAGAYRGGRLETGQLTSPIAPAAAEGPAVRVWISARGTKATHPEEDPETVKRLQALGYIQR